MIHTIVNIQNNKPFYYLLLTQLTKGYFQGGRSNYMVNERIHIVFKKKLLQFMPLSESYK